MTQFRALAGHCWLTLRLNFRSKQAILYGYFVPVLFLLAFGSVFRGDTPPLLSEVGQLLTLTLLGGCCIGLPTALVAERQRGVWRRYRLLPVNTGSLIVSTVLARTIIVLSGAVLQLALARLIYGTPFPAQVAATVLCFILVALSFTGLGLLIAALANDVPAVQSLGQCLFLPMVMIGGVGIPLEVLPHWAQVVSAYFPGRYAVEVLQSAYVGSADPRAIASALAALFVIGAAAALAGLKLFRWEAGRALGGRARAWIALAAAAWIGVGLFNTFRGRVAPPEFVPASYEFVTEKQMAAITYDDLTGDNELVTRLAPPFSVVPTTGRLADIIRGLETWPPGHVADPAQRVRNLLSLAASADIGADLLEAGIGRAVYDRLRADFPEAELKKILTWIIIAPAGGTVISSAPEFGLRKKPREEVIRERSTYYAQKYLARLLGKLKDPAPQPPS